MSNISLNYAQIIDPLSFKSINLAKIYIGEYGTLPNPAVSGTWKQAYFVNSDGTRTAASQPIRTNAAGYAVDGSGNIKPVQVDGGYSILVQDQLNATKFSQACSPVNDGAVLEFDTIPSFSGAPDGSVIYFKGRDAVGDGGGGMFRYSASSTQASDGGFVFAPTAGGRLFRDGWTVLGFNGAASVKWFGAKGDGTTNDTAAFQTAAAAVVGGVVHAPRGTYRINTIGIQGVVIEGVGFDETILEAHTATSGYLLDCTLNTDGVTTNTDGRFGGARYLKIDGRGLGAGGIRTYGGFATLEYVWARRCNIGFDIGLPIAMTVRSLYAEQNTKGFHTYSGPGDLATSLNMVGCWANSNSLYNFHIEQLTYSTFIGCASQEVSASGIGWFIEGNTNGSGVGTSLTFTSCGSEGDLGTPFYLKNQRGFTLTSPKIVQQPNNKDLIVLDNSSGEVTAYQSPGAGGGFYGLRVINLSDSLGSVVLTGGEFTMPDAELVFCTVLGSQVNGRRRLSISGNDHGQTESPTGLGVTENNYGGLTLFCGRARLTTFNPTATITGLVGGDDGREIQLFNYSSANSIILAHENAGSTAANRFVLPGAVNLTLTPYSSAVIVYDGTLQRWTVKGG